VDLFDVGRICIRRWHVVLPIILLAVLSSILVFALAKPVYYSNAVISIALPSVQVQSADPGVGVARNGLMDAGGAVLITNIIAASLTEHSVQAQVVAAGGKDNYTAKMFPVPANMQQIPLVMVEAAEPDAASASKTVELAAAQTGPVLRQLQLAAGVPEDQMVSPLVVSPPSQPEAGTSGRLKATIAILLIGVAAAVFAAVIVDVLLMRRNARTDTRRTAAISARQGSDPGGASTMGGEAGNAVPQNIPVAGRATVAGR
jgi:hypothetical protein